MKKFEKLQAKDLGKGLHLAFESIGMRDQMSIERSTGVDQSQISRIFRGDFRVASKNLLVLCKYANIALDQYTKSQVKKNGVPPLSFDKNRGGILDAFEQVWDGSPEHALALSRLILATRGLTSQTNVSIPQSLA